MEKEIALLGKRCEEKSDGSKEPSNFMKAVGEKFRMMKEKIFTLEKEKVEA
jgi:hypothetical protein